MTSNLENLAKKCLPIFPLLVSLAATGCAAHRKGKDMLLPNIELVQYKYCQIRENPPPKKGWDVYLIAVYHPLTEENAKKQPEFKPWYSRRKSFEKAKEDCEQYEKIVNEKLAEYRKNKEKEKAALESSGEK